MFAKREPSLDRMFAFCEHTQVQARYTKSALKALARMQPAKAAKIRGTVAAVAADPQARRSNQKTLKGVPNGFRLREGDWRVSFTVGYQSGILEAFEIAVREDGSR